MIYYELSWVHNGLIEYTSVLAEFIKYGIFEYNIERFVLTNIWLYVVTKEWLTRCLFTDELVERDYKQKYKKPSLKSKRNILNKILTEEWIQSAIDIKV